MVHIHAKGFLVSGIEACLLRGIAGGGVDRASRH